MLALLPLTGAIPLAAGYDADVLRALHQRARALIPHAIATPITPRGSTMMIIIAARGGGLH